MRRLTLLTTGLARGGAEAQVALLARSFHARNWHVEVVSMLPPQAHAEQLEAAGIQIHRLGMRPGVPDPRALFQLARILLRTRPDVLHSHMVHANLLGRIARLLAPVPVVVCTAHCQHEGPRWREWAYSATDRLCDLTTHVCRAGEERYRNLGVASAGKIIFVPNGIEGHLHKSNAATRLRLRREFGLEGRFAWLAVANLRASKDYPTMLAALARLANHPQEHTLLVAGCGPLEAEIRALAGQLGLDSRVRWLGRREDVPDLMSAADAILMSSIDEGTPMAILEASATELPVVATTVGGNPEAVVTEQTGYLVPPSDPAALAKAMDRMMRLSIPERWNMGRAGREHVLEHYSIETVIRRWEDLYEQLLTAARQGVRWRSQAIRNSEVAQ